MAFGPAATLPTAPLGGAKAIPAQELAGLPQELAGVDTATSGSTALPSSGVSGAGGDFTNVLGQMVGEVNEKQVAAGQAVSGLLSGGNVSLHQAMISMEEANVSFQLMIEVRNKLLDSYQELMRMQV